MALDGFRLYLPTTGEATATLTKNGLGMSKAVIAKLGKCEYVRILFDYEGKRMAIVKTDENDDAKTEFARAGKNTGIRWNSKDLVSTICQITGWKVDNEEKYTVPGEYSVDDDAMIFDFNNAIKS